MTRYTRAKGSKASNEKIPNEATPWYVMKQQLEENLSKPQERSEKNKTAKELLQDSQDVFYHDVGNVNNDWAQFEENKVVRNNNAEVNKKKKNKTDIFNANEKNVDNVIRSNSNLIKEKEGTLSKRQKRNMRKQRKDVNKNSSENDTIVTMKSKVSTKNDVDPDSNNDNTINNNKGKNENKENSHETKGLNQKSINKSNNFKSAANKFDRSKFENNKNNRKPAKIRDDKEHKRRKADIGPTKITINGMEIEIVKFDGFPIKKEDADRLRELRQKMIMKGIPKKDMEAAMKLERRKAEKALARIRRCVCFHCRKAGHNLSDCPELGSEQAATGICFKCGSTEHTHFECKVAKPSEFRYATCFICREQGHIAKQCPDNPKGVYPQGGSCKICGDVTHLKKDCPDLIKEKEESTITVNTIADGNIESLEGSTKTTYREDKKPKKIVKF
ncbi:PREDICTED: putative cell division cycle ATPase [Dufourea novaeangliae]|uniref:putative cell division cycle ATPase n=1 Tax=Dufourea novaeangliae TaxID=178035 RepID=UPI000766E7BB|nr:PREDICTED: putative cell division cycle ATPase [Dufourea novaeangliae]